MKKAQITAAFPLILLAAATVLTGRVSLFVTSISAAGLHEFGHLAAAGLSGVGMKKLSLDVFGARLETSSGLFSYKKEIFVAAAGPAVNFISAVLSLPFPFMTKFAAASLALGLLNLLPVRSFDGGRILASAISLAASPDTAERALDATSHVTVFVLWSASVYLLMKTGNSLSAFVFSLSLFVRLFS